VLLDPDKQDTKTTVHRAEIAERQGADGLLIGSSLLLSAHLDEVVKRIKQMVSIPVIIFPGSTKQISAHADAILFLSLISGRNANHLIGEQVIAAPVIKNLGIEPIATGYMLIESGAVTSAEFMSNTRPIPRDKPEIAMAHALAAEYLGMKLIYLEAGSGAAFSVPEAMIQAVASYVTLPVVVGGGIKTPAEARQKVEAGARIVVTGNVLEKETTSQLIGEFARAIHCRA